MPSYYQSLNSSAHYHLCALSLKRSWSFYHLSTSVLWNASLSLPHLPGLVSTLRPPLSSARTPLSRAPRHALAQRRKHPFPQPSAGKPALPMSTLSFVGETICCNLKVPCSRHNKRKKKLPPAQSPVGRLLRRKAPGGVASLGAKSSQ